MLTFKVLQIAKKNRFCTTIPSELLKYALKLQKKNVWSKIEVTILTCVFNNLETKVKFEGYI